MSGKNFLSDDNQWDYTKLSAKEHGGPEKFLDDIYDEGHSDGRFEGQVEGGIYALVGTAVLAMGTLATVKIRKCFKKKSEKKKEELQKKYNEGAKKIDEYCSSCAKFTCFYFDGEDWECQSCGEYNSQGEHRDSEEVHGEE